MYSFQIDDFLRENNYSISERDFENIIHSKDNSQIDYIETHYIGNFKSSYTIYTRDLFRWTVDVYTYKNNKQRKRKKKSN